MLVIRIENKHHAACAICLQLLLPGWAVADSKFDYQFGLSAGERSIDFDLSSDASGNLFVGEDGSLRPGFDGAKARFSFDESMPTALLRGTAIHHNFNLTLSLEVPVSTANTELRVRTEPAGGIGLPIQQDLRSDYELDQIDFAATLGYHVWKGLNLFAGYKYSEFELNSDEFNALLGDLDSDFAEEGLFVGASYGFRMANRGTLSFSLGYASLDAEFSQSNIPTAAPAPGFALQEYNFSGNSTGLSYGVLWVGDIDKR